MHKSGIFDMRAVAGRFPFPKKGSSEKSAEEAFKALAATIAKPLCLSDYILTKREAKEILTLESFYFLLHPIYLCLYLPPTQPYEVYSFCPWRNGHFLPQCHGTRCSA